MPDILPFRLRVISGIADILSEIANGDEYYNTLAGRVFRGRNRFSKVTDGSEPLVAILEPPIPDTPIPVPAESGHGQNNWQLLIQGFMRDDDFNPTDPAYYLLADVKKRLAIEKERTAVIPNKVEGRNANPFNLGRYREGVEIPDNGFINHVEKIVSIGQGVVRPPDEGISDTSYFWLTLVLKIQEDITNPFV